MLDKITIILLKHSFVGVGQSSMNDFIKRRLASYGRLLGNSQAMDLVYVSYSLSSGGTSPTPV